MPELQLLDFRAGSFAHHLMAQADAEHGHLAQQLLDLGIGGFNGFRVARAVAEEHAVGVHREHLFRGRVPRETGDVAAGAHKAVEDGAFDAAVVGNDFKAGLRGLGKREGLGRGKVGQSVCVGRLAGNGGRQVLADDALRGAHALEQGRCVISKRGDDGALGTVVAHVAHERARVDTFDSDDVMLGEEVGQRHG